MTNLGNDHEFINKKYISIAMRPFGDAQSKVTRAYAQSGQYHTITKGRDFLQFLLYDIIRGRKIMHVQVSVS